MAQLQVRESRTAEAEKELRRVLQIEPGNQRAYLALSVLAALRGDRAQTRQLLEAAIAANPAAVDARLRLAQLAFLDNDPKRARSLLEQALEVATDRPDLLNAVGEVLMHAGQLDDALARFNEAAAAGSQGAMINTARVQRALDQTVEARRTLETAFTMRPIAAQAAVMLIEMNSRDGRIPEARRLIERLPEFGLPSFATHELEGDVDRSAGNFDAAAKFVFNGRARTPQLAAGGQDISRPASLACDAPGTRA